jgi:hypothetical protein
MPQLPEDKRQQLDAIVSKMQGAGESDENIKFVVGDFTQKYSAPSGQSVGSPSSTWNSVKAMPLNTLKAVAKTAYNHPFATAGGIVGAGLTGGAGLLPIVGGTILGAMGGEAADQVSDSLTGNSPVPPGIMGKLNAIGTEGLSQGAFAAMPAAAAGTVGLKAGGVSLANRILKPNKSTLSRSAGRQFGNTIEEKSLAASEGLLKGGPQGSYLTVGDAGQERLAADMRIAAAAKDDIMRQGVADDVRVPMQPVEDAGRRRITAEANAMGTGAGQRSAQKVYARMRQQFGVDDPTAPLPDATLKRADDVRSATWASGRPAMWGQSPPPGTEAARDMNSALSQSMRDAMSGYESKGMKGLSGALNQQGKLETLDDVLGESLWRIGRNNPAPLDLLAAAGNPKTALSLLNRRFVGVPVAKGMYKAGGAAERVLPQVGSGDWDALVRAFLIERLAEQK